MRRAFETQNKLNNLDETAIYRVKYIAVNFCSFEFLKKDA